MSENENTKRETKKVVKVVNPPRWRGYAEHLCSVCGAEPWLYRHHGDWLCVKCV